MSRPVPARKEAHARNVSMISEFPGATSPISKQRVAVAVDRLAHFGVDVVGMAAARQPPFAFMRRQETARPPCHRAGSWMADVHEEAVQVTSGRCSASRSTAPPAASDRPSATARSNADPASARSAMLPSRGGRLMVMPSLHQAVAGRVDVVDLIGEVAEIAVLAVFLLVPIVGEFDQRRAAGLRRSS